MGFFPEDTESKQGNTINQSEWPMFSQVFKVVDNIYFFNIDIYVYLII